MSKLTPKAQSKSKSKPKPKVKSKSKSKSKLMPDPESKTTNFRRKTGWRRITRRKRKIVSKAQKTKVGNNSGHDNDKGMGDEWCNLRI